MGNLLKKLEATGRGILTRYLFSRFRKEDVVSGIPPDAPPRSILLMRWDAVGDMMVSLPWFRKVREVFPEARIGIVVSGRNAPLLAHETGFTRILYDGKPIPYLRSLAAVAEFAAEAMVNTRIHYDSTTSFLYGMASGAKWLVSADVRERKLPFNVRVRMPDGRMHISDMMRILLGGLGRELPGDGPDREPRLSGEEMEFASAFWRKAGLRLRGRAVGLNFHARDPRHRWPPGRAAELCRRFSEAGWSTVLFTMPRQHGLAVSIAESVPGVVAVPACPTVLHAAAVIRDLAMFVSPDTGLVHVASAYGVPVLGLYIPNEVHLPLWHPWNVEYEMVMGKNSVSEITVDSVVEAAGRLAGKVF